MAKNTILINDFRAGELTPDMDARADLKDYYRGCRILENAMPIIEGGVARVPGTYYVRPTKLTEEGWSLRVTKSGTGAGVVMSDLSPGIDCGSSCYYFFLAGTTVVLTGTADAGSGFTGWSGEGFSGIAPISVLMDGDKVINAEFGIMLLGMITYHMIVDNGILYMVGRRTGGSQPFLLCISKYIINGTGLSFVERMDYEGSTTEQVYHALSIYGDFIYVSGTIVDGGARKSFIRKINKNTLAVVWTYISHVDLGGGEWSYSMVSPKLHDGAVYWGNWVQNTGGQIVKLDDADGSQLWKVTTGYTLSCFEVEIPDDTNVDFIGGTTTSPEGRGISRRLQTTGAVVSTKGYGNHWFQKIFSDGTHYWITNRFSVSGDNRSTLTKINKFDLTVDWNANFDFSPNQFEQFTNVVTDGSDFYCLGFAYIASISGYCAILGKVNAAGTPGISLQHPTLTGTLYGRAAIIVTADYVFITSYNTFECRSKVDFSLIASTGI